MKVRALYFEKQTLHLLDQRLLPHRIKYIPCHSSSQTALAIKNMALRGAPAIGCAAAYGYYLDANNFFRKISRKVFSDEKSRDIIRRFRAVLKNSARILVAARPTAVNLEWAVRRMEKTLDISLQQDTGLDVVQVVKKATDSLMSEARKIFEEDIKVNKEIGNWGAKLLNKKSTVLTHCNAGALATAGYGTALGIIRMAHAQGKIKMVLVDETRPYLQGLRLTAWELSEEKIPYRIITDNMAGYFMSQKKVDVVIVGADRIASNGDTANKIGTYSLAVLASYHGIPFYVAAPTSTIDTSIKSGADIVIEERSSDEVLFFNGKSAAPPNAEALHPAFDITPACLISAIITEKGIYTKKPFHFTTSQDLTYRKIK